MNQLPKAYDLLDECLQSKASGNHAERDSSFVNI